MLAFALCALAFIAVALTMTFLTYPLEDNE